MATLRLSAASASRARDLLSRFLAHRVPLWMFMWWGLLRRDPDGLVGGVVQRARPNALFLDGWFHWESLWYMHIAREGYTNVPDALGHRDTHYWPVFPLLEKLMAIPFGGDMELGAFVLNNAMLFGSVMLFDDFCRRHLDRATARLAGSLLLVYPYAFYYSAGHTESGVLFFSLLTFHLGYQKKWFWAGVAAMVVGGMRASGFAAGAALGVMYLEDCGWSPRRIRPNAVFACLGVLGPLGFIAFLQVKFHDPLAFTSGLTAKDWGAGMTFSRFQTSMAVFSSPDAWPPVWLRVNDVFHVLCLVVAVALTLMGTLRFKPHVVVFCALTILVHLTFWANEGRYVAPLFPLYVVAAASLRPHPNLTFFVVCTSLLFMGVFAYLYGHGHWVS